MNGMQDGSHVVASRNLVATKELHSSRSEAHGIHATAVWHLVKQNECLNITIGGLSAEKLQRFTAFLSEKHERRLLTFRSKAKAQ